MRITLLTALLLMGVSCQTITEPDIAEEDTPIVPERAFSVVGYHAWWSGASWQSYDFGALDEVYFFSLEIGPDGRIANSRGWPEDWVGLVSTARATDTAVLPSVTILDSDTYRSVFGDTTATRTLLDELVLLATDTAADGVHLDFEMFDAVTPEMRQNLTDLVSGLREALDERRPDARITMYQLAEDPVDSMDETALAPFLDQVVVQAYDLHWQTGNTAGPIAPLTGWGTRNWAGILSRFESLGVPRDKMLFTVPYFGYEWPTEDHLPGSRTTGDGIVLAYGEALQGVPSARDRAAEFGKLREVTSGSPYYAYQDSTGWRQGWFEDAYSIADKYAFVEERGLSGVAIFPLAYGDTELAGALVAARIGIEGYAAP